MPREIKFRAWDKENNSMHYSNEMNKDFEDAAAWWRMIEDISMTASDYDMPLM